MIKSIKFPKKGTGYIYTKPENPGEAPDKENYRYHKFNSRNFEREFDEEKYEKDYKEWEEDKKYYEENKGKFTNPAAEFLIGKTFKFEPGKVNIIFGPNGCGKTTIIKALAGNAGIDGDGLTKPGDPLDVFGFDEDNKDVKNVAKHIEFLKMNSAEVDWDGNVVYYDNFAHTLNKGNHYIGGLEGTALGDFTAEITYRFSGSKTNAGRRAMWLLGNVLEYQKKGITLEKIFDPFLKNKKLNDTWSTSYKTQAEYFKQYENYGKEVPMTILFDEPEVNFDVPTVWKLYTEVFPAISKAQGTQFIIISHSPLILSENVLNNDMINLISISEDYTNEMKDLLKNVKF